MAIEEKERPRPFLFALSPTVEPVHRGDKNGNRHRSVNKSHVDDGIISELVINK